jgi:hypothetical protein
LVAVALVEASPAMALASPNPLITIPKMYPIDRFIVRLLGVLAC